MRQRALLVLGLLLALAARAAWDLHLVSATLALGAVWALARRSRHRRAVVAAVVLRSLVAVAFLAGLPLPDAGTDAQDFAGRAIELAALQPAPGLAAQDEAYVWALSLAGAVTGEPVETMLALNVLLGAVALLGAARIVRPDDARAASVAAWGVALFPTLVLYGGLPMREAPIVALLTWGVVAVRERRTLPAALLVLAAGLLNHGLLPLVPVVLAVGVVRAAWGRGPGVRRAAVAVVLVAGVAGVAQLVAGPSALEPEQVEATRASMETGARGCPTLAANLDDLSLVQECRRHGRSAYPAWTTLEEPTDLAWKPAARLALFLAGPFAWDAERGVDLVGALDGTLWVVLVAAAVAGVRERPGAVVVLAAGLAVFALVTSNHGTGVRHRAKFAAVAVALAAPVVLSWWDRFRAGRARGPAPRSR